MNRPLRSAEFAPYRPIRAGVQSRIGLSIATYGVATGMLRSIRKRPKIFPLFLMRKKIFKR